MSEVKQQFVQFVTDGVKNIIPGASVSWSPEPMTSQDGTTLCIEVERDGLFLGLEEQFLDEDFGAGKYEKYDAQAFLDYVATEWAKYVKKHGLQPVGGA